MRQGTDSLPPRRWLTAGRGLAMAVALAIAAATTAAATTAGTRAPGTAQEPNWQAATPQPEPVRTHNACLPAAPGRATCLTVITSMPVPGAHGRALTRQPAGYGIMPQPYLAADLRSAYKLPSTLPGTGQTVAIVDAYDDPNAASDLAAYRAANHLPACDTAFPCFTKLNQQGKEGGYPAPDSGWAVEESLDVDMVSAICPDCKVLLVEASDASDTNLALAENEAVKLGATVISNSYGEPEYHGELAKLGAAYHHPGVVIAAASGDWGFGTYLPAALPSVIAVGGTSLFPAPGTARRWSETAWTGAGSGCSVYVAKPAWQHDPLCANRTVSDVSAVADPVTPVAIYDSYNQAGWVAVGGTSVASPIIAGVYALAGNGASINPGQYLYAHTARLFDVTSGFEYTTGANGDCGGSYLCMPVRGYDGPTGNGTPDGTGAF